MLYACDILSAVILLVNGLKELDLNKFLVVLCSSRKYPYLSRQGFALWPPPPIPLGMGGHRAMNINYLQSNLWAFQHDNTTSFAFFHVLALFSPKCN